MVVACDDHAWAAELGLGYDDDAKAPALDTVAVVVNLFQCAQTLVQVVYMRVERASAE